MEASDDDIELVPLTGGQAEQFARIERLWPEFGHSLQVLAAMGGGMGWRTVDGVEYLTRYTQEDGKKKGRSLGRRSPETEAQMAHFENTVLKARRIRREYREDVLLTCKLAKAHGIARLPGRFAETLDWFWYTDINRRLSLFGGTALLAYESQSKVLAPAGLVKDDHLQFVARTGDIEALNLDEVAEACDVDNEGARCAVKDDRVLIRSNGDRRLLAEIFLPTYFLRRLEIGPAKLLRDEFTAPALRALTLSRDTRPIELAALDPRVYAVAAHCMRDDRLWARRAEFARTMVTECWPEKFTEDQELVFDGPTEAGWMRLRGP